MAILDLKLAESPCFGSGTVVSALLLVIRRLSNVPRWLATIMNQGSPCTSGLAGWGMSIGEMFDLVKLALKCQELGRYSFFLSSVPLKVPGGVASPPSAVAIF
jgi:hypothetical protein